MRNLLRKAHSVFTFFLFDPFSKLRLYRSLPYYFINYLNYKRANKTVKNKFVPTLGDIYVTTYERFEQAGTNTGHYFYQDIWAAQFIYESGIRNHVDVGSRIDGFVGHVLSFCKVDYVDLRPLDCMLKNLSFKQGSILELPYPSESLDSISCLHVIEHIDLGRYGDPIDPEGYMLAASELARVIKKGGKLIFSTPVGKERLCFDAHRIFHPNTVINEMFGSLVLKQFHLIHDDGIGIVENVSVEIAEQCDYGCGLFVFEKA